MSNITLLCASLMKGVCVCLLARVHICSRRCVSQAANPCAAAAAVDRQAFIVREAEAMIGEPDPNRVMVSRHR